MLEALKQRRAVRGHKRRCQDCERPFYDLLRDPIVCPDCGVVQTNTAILAPHDPQIAPPVRDAKWRQAQRRPVPVPVEAVVEAEAEEPEEAAAADVEDVEVAPAEDSLVDEGFLEQDADVILFIYRDEVYFPEKPEGKGRAEIIIGKQRNGPIGKVDLAFLGQFTRFENLAHGGGYG